MGLDITGATEATLAVMVVMATATVIPITLATPTSVMAADMATDMVSIPVDFCFKKKKGHNTRTC